MPLTLRRIYEYKVPKKSLSQENLEIAAEQTKEEIGSLFMGLIRGLHADRELSSQYYLGSVYDEGDSLDDYFTFTQRNTQKSLSR
jgi:hypothetical protein